MLQPQKGRFPVRVCHGSPFSYVSNSAKICIQILHQKPSKYMAAMMVHARLENKYDPLVVEIVKNPT
jgi:hypothetical protein